MEKKRIILNSKDLFKDNNREVIIQHENQEYYLKLTKAGKLILNK